MSEGVIPERIKGETTKAYQAFMDYCQMGDGRSLPKLHKLYTESTQGAPTVWLRTLKGWSSRWHWQDRVAEHRRRVAERRAEARIQRQIEIEDAVLEDTEELRAWWRERWGKYQETPSAVSTYEARQLTHLRTDIDDLERRSAGLPHRATESTVKGEGEGGAIRIEIVGGYRNADG